MVMMIAAIVMPTEVAAIVKACIRIVIGVGVRIAIHGDRSHNRRCDIHRRRIDDRRSGKHRNADRYSHTETVMGHRRRSTGE